MTNDTFLAMLRRRLRDVDDTAPLYDDTTLWGYAGDALLYAQARKVSGVVGTSATDTGFSPELADDSLGVLLLLNTAVLLLRDLYTDKVQRGELGVSFRSGLEQESTIDARKAYADAIDGLDREATELTLLRASGSSATRVQ